MFKRTSEFECAKVSTDSKTRILCSNAKELFQRKLSALSTQNL